MSPSPAARQRYMNVPNLPLAASRVSNSDRLSQASGTPRGLSRGPFFSGIRATRQVPVSPHPNFTPSLLRQDTPSSYNRMTRRQPVTPNPGANRPLIRLQSMRIDNNYAVDSIIDPPISEANRSQAGAENAPLTLLRNASRRSLLGPMR